MARAFIHPKLLASLRTIDEALMPDTAEFLDPVGVSNGQGGKTKSWPVNGTSPCRLAPAPMAPQERHVSQNMLAAPQLVTPRIEAITTWIVSFPVTVATLTPAWRLRIDDRIFEIVDIKGPHAYDSELTVICKEVK